VREAMKEASSCAGLRQVEFSISPARGRERRFLMRLDCDSDKGTLFGTCQDITERKMMEERALLSRRLAAIGSLASGVAHEINTPIQYLGNNLDYIGVALENLLDVARRESSRNGAPDAKLESRLTEYRRELPLALADMREGLERVAGIVRTLLTLSPSALQGRREVDLNALLRDLADISLGERKGNIETRLELAPEPPRVLGSPEELGQLFLNLLINAYQALEERPGGPAGGIVTVRTCVEEGWAVVDIEDNGPGIPDDIKEFIFDPFFSARRQILGSGQGLTLAQAVAGTHGGAITVSSSQGAGTVFTVRLPRGGGRAES
jgi:two-component system, NtrC family, sensor kinase